MIERIGCCVARGGNVNDNPYLIVIVSVGVK